MRDRIVGAFATGCRLGEMLKIQNRHVLWDTHQIIIPAEQEGSCCRWFRRPKSSSTLAKSGKFGR